MSVSKGVNGMWTMFTENSIKSININYMGDLFEHGIEAAIQALEDGQVLKDLGIGKEDAEILHSGLSDLFELRHPRKATPKNIAILLDAIETAPAPSENCMYFLWVTNNDELCHIDWNVQQDKGYPVIDGDWVLKERWE